MQTYQGTKTILATAMLLGAYNELRGWTPPAGEDQTVEGYLVEYTDGGKPNHPDHNGYISWSPKDVFERSYKLVETPKQRVQLEFTELSDKLTKLEAFMDSERFDTLALDQRQLLLDQKLYMRNYRSVLNNRLNTWRD
jgi:hypothetical protein